MITSSNVFRSHISYSKLPSLSHWLQGLNSFCPRFSLSFSETHFNLSQGNPIACHSLANATCNESWKYSWEVIPSFAWQLVRGSDNTNFAEANLQRNYCGTCLSRSFSLCYCFPFGIYLKRQLEPYFNKFKACTRKNNKAVPFSCCTSSRG